MERNSMSNNLKDHNLNGKTIISNNNKPIKSPWESSNRSSTYGEDYTCGFSWPPRSYICSFCKREFRSAQALGGHMNVHRRDRARLRQYSPPIPTVMVGGQYSHIRNLNLNSNPNCNPNLSSSSSASSTTRLPPCTCTLPSLVSPNSLSSSSSASPNEMKKWGNEDAPLLVPSSPPSSLFLSSKIKTTKSLFRAKEVDQFTQEDECKFSTKGEINVRLDLGIGFLPDSKEDVDLELRLGYS